MQTYSAWRLFFLTFSLGQWESLLPEIDELRTGVDPTPNPLVLHPLAPARDRWALAFLLATPWPVLAAAFVFLHGSNLTIPALLFLFYGIVCGSLVAGLGAIQVARRDLASFQHTGLLTQLSLTRMEAGDLVRGLMARWLGLAMAGTIGGLAVLALIVAWVWMRLAGSPMGLWEGVYAAVAAGLMLYAYGIGRIAIFHGCVIALEAGFAPAVGAASFWAGSKRFAQPWIWSALTVLGAHGFIDRAVLGWLVGAGDASAGFWAALVLSAAVVPPLLLDRGLRRLEMLRKGGPEWTVPFAAGNSAAGDQAGT
ncbi:MAG: hypothetical protein RLY93_18420 [Sumerlaeia bacterium]